MSAGSGLTTRTYVQSTADVFETLPSRDNHNVLGSMADLSAASVADVAAFLRAFYSPNNASLAIVGNFTTPETKRLVEQYFGPLQPGPTVRKLKPNRLITSGSRYVSRSERVSHPRTTLSWTTVEIGHQDEPALRILAAVLGQLPRENRLYRTLIAEKHMATQANASSAHTEVEGSFKVTITARPGQSLDALVIVAQREIERLRQNGPTEDEVAKAQITLEAAQIFDMQSVTRLANFLNSNNVLFGNPTAHARPPEEAIRSHTRGRETRRPEGTSPAATCGSTSTRGPQHPGRASRSLERQKDRTHLQSIRPPDPKSAEGVVDGSRQQRTRHGSGIACDGFRLRPEQGAEDRPDSEIHTAAHCSPYDVERP